MPVTPQQLRLEAGVLHSMNEVSGPCHIGIVLHLSFACQEVHRCFLHQGFMPQHLPISPWHSVLTMLSIRTGELGELPRNAIVQHAG